MDFSEVVNTVKSAISDFETWVKANPGLILSEADFERHLSNAISDLLAKQNNSTDTFVVHNQISHYPDDEYQHRCKRDSQVDILIMKDENIQNDSTISKGFVYAGDAIPIELKYYRKGQTVSSIINDLEKSESLLNGNNHFNCSFFVIALLEEENDNQMGTIQHYFEQYQGKENMFTFCFSKTRNH